MRFEEGNMFLKKMQRLYLSAIGVTIAQKYCHKLGDKTNKNCRP